MALKKKSKPKVEKPADNGKYFTISIEQEEKNPWYPADRSFLFYNS